MIEIRDLSFGYHKGRLLFNSLSTVFEPGRIYGLLGKNGAGKTTLLKLIVGLRYPQFGEVRVFGHLAYRREPEMLQDLVILPEVFELPELSARQFLKAYASFYSKFDYRRFEQMIGEFELDMDKNLKFMSFGQKKKFYIAFLLSTGARLILMDEPTNGLDIPSKVKFRKLVASVLSEDNLIVISTHQVRDVYGLIDYVKIIDDGKIIFDYSLDDVNSYLRVEQVSDSVPQSAFYSEAIGQMGNYVLLPNDTNIAQQVDLELLFNAVVYGDLQRLTEYLNSKISKK